MSGVTAFTGEALLALVAALAFTGLALVSIVRDAMFGQRAYPVALLATAGWLFALAIVGPGHVASALAEAARNLAWLWFMAAVAGGRETPGRIKVDATANNDPCTASLLYLVNRSQLTTTTCLAPNQ